MKNQSNPITLAASRGVCFLIALAVATPPTSSARASDPLDSPNVNRGDTAPTIPPVGRICEVLRDASAGNFKDKKGNPVTFTDPSCATMSRRARDGAASVSETGKKCQTSIADLTRGMKEEDKAAQIDSLCRSAHGTLKQEAAVYCTLREAANTGQATKYCEAYESAENASKGLTAMLALNGAGAAICWTEYMSLKLIHASRNPGTISSAAEKSGACSYAAMGAALAEIVNVIMANTGSNNHATGEFRIDGSGNAIKKDDEKVKVSKILDIIATSSMSLALIRNGLCQQARGRMDGNMGGNAKGVLGALGVKHAKKICGFLNAKLGKNEIEQKKNTADANEKGAKAEGDLAAYKKDFERLSVHGACGTPEQVKAHTAYAVAVTAEKTLANNGDQGIGGKCTQETMEAHEKALKEATAKVEAAEAALAATDLATKGLETAQKASAGFAQEAAIQEAQTRLQPRLDVTKSSAMILTGLAAMRGVSLVAAGGTKKKSRELLESMFQSNGEGAALGMTGIGNVQQNIYAATGGGTYVSPGAQPIRAGAVASTGTPESYMLTPNGPLANAAVRVANQIPRSKVEEAAAGGGAGIGGMIAATAGALGAKGDLSEIRSATSSMFANFSQEAGGYAGGGGSSLASKDSSGSGDLNLKSLFGGGEAGESAAGAAPELSYREPASEDIWHSQNPKGHNLFQIVSDKYDTVQRKSAVGSDL